MSPWPPVWVSISPAFTMRGPVAWPPAIACCKPVTSPPRSRTVVKPRSTVALARAAIRMPNSTSLILDSAAKSMLASRKCTWPSISPGRTYRPAASITVSALGAAPSSTETMRPSSITTWRSPRYSIDVVSSTVPLTIAVRMSDDGSAAPVYGGSR